LCCNVLNNEVTYNTYVQQSQSVVDELRQHVSTLQQTIADMQIRADTSIAVSEFQTGDRVCFLRSEGTSHYEALHSLGGQHHYLSDASLMALQRMHKDLPTLGNVLM